MTRPGDSPADLPQLLARRMQELGVDSIRGLAARAGIAVETARRLLSGSGEPEERTLQKVANGLALPLAALRQAAGVGVGERAPFVLPPEADQLTESQRRVVLSMVRALLDVSRSGHDRPDQSPDGDAEVYCRPRLVGRRRHPLGPEDDA